MYDSYSILDNHAALNKFKVFSGKTLRDCNYVKSGKYTVKRKEMIRELFQKISIEEWEEYRSLFYPLISMDQVAIDCCKKIMSGKKRCTESNKSLLQIIYCYHGIELLIYLFQPYAFNAIRVSDLY